MEERERQRRVNNIIIYGMSEERDKDNIQLQEHDKEFVTSLLATLEVDVRPKQVIRLGKINNDRNRPVEVIMGCADDKHKIMPTLTKLKGLKDANETFRSLSIRDDYTIEERKLIKTFVDEAKQKTKRAT